MNDPVDPLVALASGDSPVQPSPAFTDELRRRIVDALSRPRRSTTMSTTTSTTTTSAGSPSGTTAHGLRPYLAVHDGAAALEFYRSAFDAEVVVRMVGDDGRLGHAELRVGAAEIYLADEYPSIGVVGPRTLGGTSVTLHLEVDDVDAAFGRAEEAGATVLTAPSDQAHGARHGTLLDPFGHRWMLSQQVERLDDEQLAARMAATGYEVVGRPAPDRHGRSGGVWAAVQATDARAMIRFAVDVLGFDEELVVAGADRTTVEHSQLRWPEGGVVQVATADRPGNVFARQPPAGGQNLYVITADPQAVHRRCVEANVEVVSPPASPDHDPHGVAFSVRDHEGNLWSFGTYAGG